MFSVGFFFILVSYCLQRPVQSHTIKIFKTSQPQNLIINVKNLQHQFTSPIRYLLRFKTNLLMFGDTSFTNLCRMSFKMFKI